MGKLLSPWRWIPEQSQYGTEGLKDCWGSLTSFCDGKSGRLMSAGNTNSGMIDTLPTEGKANRQHCFCPRTSLYRGHSLEKVTHSEGSSPHLRCAFQVPPGPIRLAIKMNNGKLCGEKTAKDPGVHFFPPAWPSWTRADWTVLLLHLKVTPCPLPFCSRSLQQSTPSDPLWTLRPRPEGRNKWTSVVDVHLSDI